MGGQLTAPTAGFATGFEFPLPLATSNHPDPVPTPGRPGIPAGHEPLHPTDLAELLGTHGTTPIDPREQAIAAMLLPPGSPPGTPPSAERVDQFYRGLAAELAKLPPMNPEVREILSRMHQLELTKNLCTDEQWTQREVQFLGGVATAAVGARTSPLVAALGLIGAGAAGDGVLQCQEAQIDYDATVADENATRGWGGGWRPELEP